MSNVQRSLETMQMFSQMVNTSRQKQYPREQYCLTNMIHTDTRSTYAMYIPTE